MIGQSRPQKSVIVFLAIIFFLAGCYSKDNFVSRNPYQEAKGNAGNLSQQDIQKFASSVRKIDGNVEAKYRLARHFQKRKRHKIALETLKEVVQLDPTYVKAYNAMGVSYDYLGDFKKAIHAYNLALKINPNLDYVYNNLGFAYLLIEKYDSAINAFQKAIALDDQNKRFRNNLGFAYAKKGQFDLAIVQFRITGDEFSANYKLGQLLYREGNYEKALEYNEKAYHAKASAQIMSSVLNSHTERGSGTVSKEEKEFPVSKSFAPSSDYERSSLIINEKKPVTAISDSSGLHTKNLGYDAAVSQTSPMVISKSKKENPGFIANQFALKGNNKELMKGARSGKGNSKNIIVEVEIEILNGNGVNGMARRLGSYLRKNGLKVSRLANAKYFGHEKTKIFYYNGNIQDVHRLLQGIPSNMDIKHIIELKRKRNRVKILIGKDMIPYDKVISKTHFAKHAS